MLALLTMINPRSDILRPEPFRKSVSGTTPELTETSNTQTQGALSQYLPQIRPQKSLTAALPTTD